MKARHSFTEEFKCNAVAYFQAHQGEISHNQMAANLGVSLAAFNRWITDPLYQTGGSIHQLKTTGAGDLEVENKQLKKENARLREEREILKKAAAFFAGETNRTKL